MNPVGLPGDESPDTGRPSIAQSSRWVLAGTLLAKPLQLATNVLLARVLGPALGQAARHQVAQVVGQAGRAHLEQPAVAVRVLDRQRGPARERRPLFFIRIAAP